MALSDQAFIRAYADAVCPASVEAHEAALPDPYTAAFDGSGQAHHAAPAPMGLTKRARRVPRAWNAPPAAETLGDEQTRIAPAESGAADRLQEEIQDAVLPARGAQIEAPPATIDRWQWPEIVRRLDGSSQGPLPRIHAAIQDRRGTLNIAGVSRGQGCTTTVLWLSRCLASMGVTVVAVDADFANPAMATQLGWQPAVGWQSVLAGQAGLQEALVTDLAEGITLLPLTAAVDDPWPSMERGVTQSLQELAGRFDIVLLDGGPWFAMPPELCDALVLVADVRQTSPAETRLALSALAATRAPVVGICDNFVTDLSAGPDSLQQYRIVAA